MGWDISRIIAVFINMVVEISVANLPHNYFLSCGKSLLLAWAHSL